MSRCYLVTGGTGFLGSALVRHLLQQGHRVRVLDNDSRGNVGRLKDLQGEFEFVAADIRDADSVNKATAGVDGVCHLAFVNGTEFFYTRPEFVLDVGVKGMINVIDACLMQNVGELILASSSEVYQTPPSVPTDETAPLSIPDVLNPRYSYAAGKIISEVMAINYGRKHFQRVVIFRPHNVYGPDMGREHVIPQFALRMKECFGRQPSGVVDFPIQGSGEETRAFIYIDDFTRALLRVIETGEHLNIYHIGTDREVSVRELAQTAARCCGREIRIVPGDLLKGSTARRCPDIRKLRRLGFVPSVPLEEGVRLTVEWYFKKLGAVQ